MLILYRNNIISCYCFKSLVALQVNYYYDHVIVTITTKLIIIMGA